MRVMLLIGQLAKSGAEPQFALLAGDLVKKVHDVCSVTLTDTGDSHEYLQLLGEAERRILFKRRHSGPLRFVQFSWAWRPFRRLIREFKPYVEAISCGVPSVATNVGESALLLQDVGQTVPHGDPIAPADGIEAALNQSKPSMKSRERISSAFSVDSMVEQTVSVFDELLHGVHQ
ncbi:MAG: hypothetical protein CBC35_00625 [Planctomycetes bacterium TMED75]|nr:hypothetical protein [Planctomycetaceae bacterium]OUU96766.1 MAG: hypothetical protein CBC35_00625 [Planctomycetes bacterium TMED75]